MPVTTLIIVMLEPIPPFHFLLTIPRLNSSTPCWHTHDEPAVLLLLSFTMPVKKKKLYTAFHNVALWPRVSAHQTHPISISACLQLLQGWVEMMMFIADLPIEAGDTATFCSFQHSVIWICLYNKQPFIPLRMSTPMGMLAPVSQAYCVAYLHISLCFFKNVKGLHKQIGWTWESLRTETWRSWNDWRLKGGVIRSCDNPLLC